ncbi:MAG: O-antigen ligase family protein [Cypionkella sp.]
MPSRRPAPAEPAQARTFLFLALFLAALWFAGGASRPDVPGQVVTRIAAWSIAILAVVFLPRPDWRSVRAPAVLLAAAAGLVALQLVPLPPSMWQALPGREVFAAGDALIGAGSPWRPLSMSPGWTRNALGSLIVPAVALWLMAGLGRGKDLALMRLLLVLVVGGCLIALLQFAGRPVDHPMLNDIAGHVSGNFANRNHLALFAAIGCVLGPVWASRETVFGGWAVLVGAALVTLFVLVILATGSRGGIVLGALGVGAGLALAWAPLRQRMRALPRRVSLGAGLAIAGGFVAALVASVLSGRAAGIERAIELSAQDDARVRVLPAVLEALARYFPVGSGFGTFDPVFRISEGDDLLDRTYYNQAHNDLLQVGLDGGIAGLVLLGAALAWWAARSWRAARGGSLSARAGAAILLLIVVGSALDYPARTPMIMAVAMIAAAWLARVNGPSARPAGANPNDGVGLPSRVPRI